MRHGPHRPRYPRAGRDRVRGARAAETCLRRQRLRLLVGLLRVGRQSRARMSVLDGPRKELRRIAMGGRVHLCRLEGDDLVLDDGRTVPEAGAVYYPPVD